MKAPKHSLRKIVNFLNNPDEDGASGFPTSNDGCSTLSFVSTRHQDTTTAIDGFGNRHEIPLLKGKYKDQPNNPKRPDGTLHEYCPPVHVDAEMERLLKWLLEYSEEDPIIVMSWIHHRFTQIHPYQDGNGRVAVHLQH